jgi:hypothetical protein
MRLVFRVVAALLLAAVGARGAAAMLLVVEDRRGVGIGTTFYGADPGQSLFDLSLSGPFESAQQHSTITAGGFEGTGSASAANGFSYAQSVLDVKFMVDEVTPFLLLASSTGDAHLGYFVDAAGIAHNLSNQAFMLDTLYPGQLYQVIYGVQIISGSLPNGGGGSWTLSLVAPEPSVPWQALLAVTLLAAVRYTRFQ